MTILSKQLTFQAQFEEKLKVIIISNADDILLKLKTVIIIYRYKILKIQFEKYEQ